MLIFYWSSLISYIGPVAPVVYLVDAFVYYYEDLLLTG